MPRVLDQGRNCGILARASRFALLVDGSNYYAALAQSLPQARHTIAIVGWDLDSRVRLGPGAGEEPLEPPIRDFLPALANANPGLNIYILSWNFPLLFANVRDPKLVWGRDPFNHPRVHLKFDSTHPPGASHHQKIVVIDDCLAFAGGMDIAGGRWDSPEHRAYDIRRAGKDEPYAPSHDVQALVDGEAATALADIVRDRWRRSTGAVIPRSSEKRNLWPDRITPDLVDVTVAISRTDVDAEGSGRREIEQLHFDLIAAARDCIYIENQYLTSVPMATALARRLESPEGPEVLIVLPLNNSGWLEENTIEVLRGRCVRQLRQADRFKRLRICYPVVPDLDGTSLGVHSKVVAIDDRLFRIGSSNLTNRSMRLDTECDLTIEATSDPERLEISRLRNCLLGEHLGMSADEVRDVLSTDPSLVRLVDSRSRTSRCLRDLPAEDHSAAPIVDDDLVDPSRPITPDVVIEALASSVAGRPLTRLLPWLLGGAAMTVAAVGLWRTFRARSRPPQP
jgi:phospholipase D1/2